MKHRMYEVNIKVPGKKGHPLAKIHLSEDDLQKIYDRVDSERDNCSLMESVAGFISSSGIVSRTISVSIEIEIDARITKEDGVSFTVPDIESGIRQYLMNRHDVSDVYECKAVSTSLG